MLVRTAGFLPGGECVRLMTVITQGMRRESLEGQGCKQRLGLKRSAQGRDQGEQADRPERQVECTGENEELGVGRGPR